MMSDQKATTVTTGRLLPCPFCEMDLIRTEYSAQDGIRDPFYEHPDSKCILRVLTFMDRPDMVDRWNRRIATAPFEPAAVKPLEWHERAAGGCEAETVAGIYFAYPSGQWTSPKGSHLRVLGTLETAKAAAQADFDQRIRAALEQSP